MRCPLRLPNVLLLPLVVCFVGCKSTAPQKSELDEITHVRYEPIPFLGSIPIKERIELRKPANTPRIRPASGKVHLTVKNGPGLRTLGHVADGSVTYLLSTDEARKLAAKESADQYIFSHVPKWNVISKFPPKEWIEQAIKNQLLQSGFQVESGGNDADRAIIIEVNNLVVRQGSKGFTMRVGASVGFTVSLKKNGQEVGQREVVGEKPDMGAGVVATQRDNAKALQAALEDGLSRFAQFVEQTSEFYR